MSDLQAELEVMDTYDPEVLASYPLVVDAARKVANPDYDAMLRILWKHFYEDMEGNPLDPDEAWEYNKEWSKIQMSGLPESLWAAALSVTDDEDPLVVTSADGSQTYFHDRTEDE